MCPTNDANCLTRHANATNRITSCTEDYNIPDPTFAPTPKLTRIDLAGLYVSCAAYDTWSEAYRNDLRLCIGGLFSEYHKWKERFLSGVEASRKHKSLNEEDSIRLEWFFSSEMEKLDPCVRRLEPPSYDELLDEVLEAFTGRAGYAAGMLKEF
ncbi:hypothetical protein BDV10DRAFT_180543 [Aspergillus recurvatus]